MTIDIAAIGLTHSHIYGQVDCLLREGARLVGFWSDEEDVAKPFAEKYPQARRAADRRELLDNPAIKLILTSAIPAKRAEIALAAMRAGKDVMSDKPGMTSLEQLAEIKRVQAATAVLLRYRQAVQPLLPTFEPLFLREGVFLIALRHALVQLLLSKANDLFAPLCLFLGQ